METARVQKLDGKTVLEITTSETVTKRVTQARLLERKAYFETMIAKGQAGLEEAWEPPSCVGSPPCATRRRSIRNRPRERAVSAPCARLAVGETR